MESFCLTCRLSQSSKFYGQLILQHLFQNIKAPNHIVLLKLTTATTLTMHLAGLRINVAKLSISTTDRVKQVPCVYLGRSPVEANEIVLCRLFGQNVHPILRALHLLDPLDTVDYAVMKPKDWISRGGVKVLGKGLESTMHNYSRYLYLHL